MITITLDVNWKTIYGLWNCLLYLRFSESIVSVTEWLFVGYSTGPNGRQFDTRYFKYSISFTSDKFKVVVLTVLFSRTNFTAFSWQLDWFIARWFWTFIFDVSTLDSCHDSPSFRHLCKRENAHKLDQTKKMKCEKRQLSLNPFARPEIRSHSWIHL